VYTPNQRSLVWLFVSLMTNVMLENQLHESRSDAMRLVLFCVERDTSGTVLAASGEQLNRKNIWF